MRWMPTANRHTNYRLQVDVERLQIYSGSMARAEKGEDLGEEIHLLPKCDV
jgi:hypothetical protein